MCGFAGFLGGNQLRDADATLRKMAETILHRGPDAYGAWHNETAGIALSHRRLSILELSDAGAQPMTSACGRYVIAFNGEIYNHLQLRESLVRDGSQPNWRGHSDTETLLAGFSSWGVRETVERSIGMFAFAVWDQAERVLTLCRDRLGEKPLYYGWLNQGQRKTFLFGSELKALKAHPDFDANINRDALCLMMRHNCIPAPHSIYQGVYKLPPGHLLTVSLSKLDPVVEPYWSLAEVATEGVKDGFQGSDIDATNALENLLRSAVKQQMISDVPLGAFLSGGIDSSTIVALMQEQSSQPVKTFTIGFHEEGYNEAVHAKAVAQHLGTDHTEWYVRSQQALDVVPNLSTLYCEPFSDSSQIPTFLVAMLARKKVTVSLSGDAGDELFAGYNRYVMANRLWDRLARLPVGLRGLIAKGIQSVSPNTLNSLLRPAQGVLPSRFRMVGAGDKLHKAASVLGSRDLDELYLGLTSHWNPAELVIRGTEPLTPLRGKALPLGGLDQIQRMMALDTITYLPDDILVKVDRAAMGVSLETRTPFLDHRVVEFAWKLPQHMKLRDGMGKWILRQVLYKHVPKKLIERPKMGFGVPIDSWLRGPLRGWAESLLDEHRLRHEGFFHPAPIRQKWAEHLSGKHNWQHHLWDVLMFQSWLETQHSS